MEQSVTLTSKPKVSKLAVLSFILSLLPYISLIGMIVGFITLSRIRKNKDKYRGQGLAITAMVLGFVFFAGPLFVPELVTMPRVVKQVTVLETAYSIRRTVEDYRDTHQGACPKCIRDFEHLLSRDIRNKKNPYNTNQTYTASGGGLVDGEPAHLGEIGYIAPRDPAEPYRILAYRKGDTLRITGEVATPKADTGGSTRP